MAAFTVAEYLATRLRDIGVQHVFTVPGLLRALPRSYQAGGDRRTWLYLYY
jgi:hypothetical protein